MNRCEHPSIARCTIRPAAIKPAQAIEESDSDEEYEYEEYYNDGPTIADDPDFKVDDARCLPDDPDIFHPVQFSHPTDCTMFYKCFDHRAYKIQCPSGLHYSAKSEQCDYPGEILLLKFCVKP
jgi:Chitin binding Peritrophin-A domain